jgi:hypothetical protein
MQFDIQRLAEPRIELTAEMIDAGITTLCEYEDGDGIIPTCVDADSI